MPVIVLREQTRKTDNLRLLVAVSLSAMSMASQAHALPSGGNVSAGTAQIASSSSAMNVTQTSNRAVIDWQSFDIGGSESVNYQQPASSSVALNRVNGGTPSQIDGSLTANGQVWIVNPDGVAFGSTAQVNVGGLVATTSNISNSQFMAGSNTFSLPGNPGASVTNQGSITVADTGLAALVAPTVQNSGTITARLGTIALASGDTFTVDTYGDGLIQIQASNQITQQLVQNSGSLKADGGTIHISAAAASQAVSSLINLSGIEQANTVGTHGGKIVVYAAGTGRVQNGGTVLANGTSGSNGGTIRVVAKGGYSDTLQTLVSAQSDTGIGGSIGIFAGQNASVAASGTYNVSGRVGGSIAMNSGQSITLTGAQLLAEGQTGGGTITLGISKASFQPSTLSIDGMSVLSTDTEAGTGGSINIAANTVSNAGKITANGSTGGTVTITAADLTQAGLISAEGTEGPGGTVSLNIAKQFLDSASSLISVASNGTSGGTIEIIGSDNASMTVTGTYITDGEETGGGIDMEAGQNLLLLGAFLSARGGTSGGLIRIGGNYIGTTGNRKADDTEVDENTTILADATNGGDGGSITVSGTTIFFAGYASAQGGVNGGNGGSITLFAPGTNAVAGNIAADKTGTATSQVLDSGTLEASGYGPGGTGGIVSVLGDNVGIMSGAMVDASGDTGGGYVRIGGDFHGAGTTPTALNTYVDPNSLIMANANTSGNGGNVVVWSDQYTQFYGTIDATGGSQSGNGGFVETSGHELLSLNDATGGFGMVYVSAPHGQAGNLLLDPADVTICSTTGNCPSGVAADNGAQGAPTYTPTGSVAESQILASEIDAYLNAGTNVTITTGGDSASGTSGGSITVAAAISARRRHGPYHHRLADPFFLQGHHHQRRDHPRRRN